MLSLSRMVAFVRQRMLLLILGVACELLYFFYFVHHFPLLGYYQSNTDMGKITGYSHPGFAWFGIVFSLLFTLFGLAWWEARHWNDRATLGLIFGFGALFALTMTFVYPVTAIDLFVYVADSLALVHYHANPMITAPASVANDPLIILAGGWASYPAPYGPLGLDINALPTLLVGRNLLANLLLLKLMFAAMLLAEAFLVYKILLKYAPKYALPSAVFLAWNPYALFEYCANGHNDLAMMLFVLLAVLALVQNRLELAFVFVVASTLVKFATLPLLPLFFLYSVVHQPTKQKRLLYVVVVPLFSLALISALYWPFWQGWKTFDRLGFQNSLYMSSFSTMLPDLSSGQVARDQAKWLGQFWFGIIYAYALFLATQSKVRLLQGCFLASFSFLAFGVTNFEIWYAIWPVIFAVLLPTITTQLSMLLFLYSTSLSVLLYGYLWVWLGLTDSALALINDVAYLLVFGPAFLLLGGFTLQRWFHGVSAAQDRFYSKEETTEPLEKTVLAPPERDLDLGGSESGKGESREKRTY